MIIFTTGFFFILSSLLGFWGGIIYNNSYWHRAGGPKYFAQGARTMANHLATFPQCKPVVDRMKIEQEYIGEEPLSESK